MYSSVLFAEGAGVTSLIELEKIYRASPQTGAGNLFFSSSAHYLARHSTLDLAQTFKIDNYF